MTLDDATADLTMTIAMTVRNAMEDFHLEHLSDEQMAELNPIIRNAIATALYAIDHSDDDPRCAFFLNFQNMLVPDCWERPEILPELAKWRDPSASREEWDARRRRAR